MTEYKHIDGRLLGFQLSPHYDYLQLHQTPQKVRNLVEVRDRHKIVPSQKRNLVHHAHIMLPKQAKAMAPDRKRLIPLVVDRPNRATWTPTRAPSVPRPSRPCTTRTGTRSTCSRSKCGYRWAAYTRPHPQQLRRELLRPFEASNVAMA